MAARTGFPGTIVDGVTAINAANNNTLPGGEIARSILSADVTGITATAVVCTENVVVGASRRLWIVGSGSVTANVTTAAQAVLRFGGSQIQRTNFWIAQSGSYHQFFVSKTYAPAASGTFTIDLVLGISTDTNNGSSPVLAAQADGESSGAHKGTCELVVFDMGPAY